MVYKYRRKTKRASWGEDAMKGAMEEVTKRKTPVRAASRMYGIPYPTLRKHLKKGSSKKILGRYRTTFTFELEEELVSYLKKMEYWFYGLTKHDLSKLALQYAEKNGIPHSFSKDGAGEQWIMAFLKRHPALSFRTPEPTSVARARGFNRPAVSRFFSLLREVLDKYGFSATDIYNVDESGIRTSVSRPPKIIASRGKKQVGVITSAEKGKLVTVLLCCSAAGQYIPPAMVFPRKRFKPQLVDKAPVGTAGFVSDSGWVNSDVFLDWLKFFIANVRPSKEKKVLLIVDNHESHRSMKVLDYASENGVVMLSVPPHTTHKLQPLDVAVYGPLKAHFERAIDVWQKSHPGRSINQYDMGELFCKAYIRAATVENAIQGFAKCGISACDMSVFQDCDFAPAEVTDRPEEPTVSNDSDGSMEEEGELPDEPRTNVSVDPTSSLLGNSAANDHNLPAASASIDQSENPQSSSVPASPSPPSEGGDHANESQTMNAIFDTASPTLADSGGSVSNDHVLPAASAPTDQPERPQPGAAPASPPATPGFVPADFKSHVSPQEIHPYPKQHRATVTQRKRKKQRAEILTSTPFKRNLQNTKKETGKKAKAKSKAKRKVKRNILPTTSSSPSSSHMHVKQNRSRERQPSGHGKNWYCLVCNELYIDPITEEWIQCDSCRQWAHENCTSYEGVGRYICDECED